MNMASETAMKRLPTALSEVVAYRGAIYHKYRSSAESDIDSPFFTKLIFSFVGVVIVKGVVADHYIHSTYTVSVCTCSF